MSYLNKYTMSSFREEDRFRIDARKGRNFPFFFRPYLFGVSNQANATFFRRERRSNCSCLFLPPFILVGMPLISRKLLSKSEAESESGADSDGKSNFAVPI